MEVDFMGDQTGKQTGDLCGLTQGADSETGREDQGRDMSLLLS